MKKIVSILFVVLLTYVLGGCENNEVPEVVKDTVEVTENTAPEIDVDKVIVIDVFSEPNWLTLVDITDDIDGTIEPSIEMFELGTFDENVPGSYLISISVSDSDGDISETSFTVEVIDQTPPLIEGVTEVYIKQGNIFDALAGITASDNYDGDISKSIEVAGIVDVDEPGVYELEYTVYDSAGNMQKIKREVLVQGIAWEDTELISASKNADSWTFWQADYNGAVGVVEIENGELSVDIQSAGVETWDVQLFQENFSVENGKQYIISFDAKSGVEKEINVSFGDAYEQDPFFTEYAPTTKYILSESFRSFELIFTMNEASTDDQGKLVFEFGKGATTLVVIDNVRLEEYDGSNAIDGTNQVVYGDFTSATLLGWSKISDQSITSNLIDDGGLVFEYNQIGENENSNQLIYKDLLLEENEEYRISFEAMGDVSRLFSVNVISSDESFDKVIDLTDEWQSYEINVTVSKDDIYDLVFMLGDFGETSGSKFWIREVKIEKSYIVEVEKEVEEIELSWESWVDGAAGAVSEMYIGDGVMTVETSSVGVETWSVQVYQEGYKVENGKQYIITFDAMADVETEIMMAFGDALEYEPWFIEYVEKTPFTLSNEMNTYELIFTMDESSTIDQGKLVFELGITPISKVIFDNISLKEFDGEMAIEDTNQISNGSFDE